MTEPPGLFDLPDPPPTSPARASRDRGRRSEHWTRTASRTSFAELWNRADDPFAPLTHLPGATGEPISVEVVRAR